MMDLQKIFTTRDTREHRGEPNQVLFWVETRLAASPDTVVAAKTLQQTGQARSLRAGYERSK